MKNAREELLRERRRVWMALFLMLLGLGGVGGFLWNLQVVQQHQYQSKIMTQSIRRVRIPAWRGCIYDRMDRVLADNRPSYCVSLYLEELRQAGRLSNTVDYVDALIDDLAAKIETPRQITREALKKHIFGQRMLPLVAWKDLDQNAVAKWAERVGAQPGLDLSAEAVRVYPYDELACHTLGYVGMGGMGDAAERTYDFYLDEMEGKAGLEKVYDEVLRGEAGGHYLQIDAFGFRYEMLGAQDAHRGKDLKLTLDARIQRIAEEALGTEPGSCVVLDPYSGDILALVSYPRYNLNDFIPRIPSTLYRALNLDPRTPWINRPIYGAYPPGSTFKMIVALAALSNNKATADTEYFCPGYLEIGNQRMHCGHRNGHGYLNMREAIAHSCNVYFFHLGMDTGYDAIYAMAAGLGLGERSGIELGDAVEKPGLLPSRQWKRDKVGYGWTDGDTCNISIGQGYLNTTPLQMAVVTAALANGGRVVRPRLIRGMRDGPDHEWEELPPLPGHQMAWRPQDLELVRGGMYDVIMSGHGTARSARIPGLAYAGKTGTAQFGPRGNKKYHAWFVAFAPYDQPRYAIAMMLDSADAAGLSAAPKVRRIVQQLFGFTDAAIAPPPGDAVAMHSGGRP